MSSVGLEKECSKWFDIYWVFQLNHMRVREGLSDTAVKARGQSCRDWMYAGETSQGNSPEDNEE